MRWPKAYLTVLLALAAGAGCRNCDRVESELRSREREVQELRDHLHRCETFNACLQREIHQHQEARPALSTPAPPSSQPLPEKPAMAKEVSGQRQPVTVATPIPYVTSIVLGRQTGGHDDDRRPGDEALQLVVEPRDPDGHALKVPGALHVIALEISPEGIKVPLCSWDVGPEKLRGTWQHGLFSSGFFIVLPWKVCPTTEKLRVIAQLTLADGRVFEADKDIKVQLPPPELRQPRPEATGEPALSLPPPRKLGGPTLAPESNRPPLREPTNAAGIRTTALWQGGSRRGQSPPIRLLPPEPLNPSWMGAPANR